MFSYTFWHHVCHITSLTKQMWLSDSTSYYFLPLLIPHAGSLEVPESIPPGHVTNLLQGLTETLRSLWMERWHGWCKSCPQFPNSSHICCCRHTREMIGQSCRFVFWLIFYFYLFLNQFVFNFTCNHVNIGFCFIQSCHHNLGMPVPPFISKELRPIGVFHWCHQDGRWVARLV